MNKILFLLLGSFSAAYSMLAPSRVTTLTRGISQQPQLATSQILGTQPRITQQSRFFSSQISKPSELQKIPTPTIKSNVTFQTPDATFAKMPVPEQQNWFQKLFGGWFRKESPAPDHDQELLRLYEKLPIEAPKYWEEIKEIGYTAKITQEMFKKELPVVTAIKPFTPFTSLRGVLPKDSNNVWSIMLEELNKIKKAMREMTNIAALRVLLTAAITTPALMYMITKGIVPPSAFIIGGGAFVWQWKQVEKLNEAVNEELKKIDKMYSEIERRRELVEAFNLARDLSLKNFSVSEIKSDS